MLRDAFDTRPRLNKSNMLQLRRMNDETPEFPPHSDFCEGQDHIAAFLYLSDGWDQQRGSRLCIHAGEAAASPAAFVGLLLNRRVAAYLPARLDSNAFRQACTTGTTLWSKWPRSAGSTASGCRRTCSTAKTKLIERSRRSAQS
jgi:hypothetical protein